MPCFGPGLRGGAFLAPVAAKIVAENRGLSARQLVKTLGERIRGFEIDPFSGWSSQVFLESTSMSVCRAAGDDFADLIWPHLMV